MGYDGSINIDTKIDSSGFNQGVKGISGGLDGITSSLKKLAAAAGIAFGVAAVVNFGKASVSAATELSNAMMGLQSIMEGQGRNFKAAQAFIQQYTADGLIPATNAITAYKNLASRGYTDPQIQNTLQALKDSAAFGRQASYSLGDAVTSATEGLKNENSILVDNAGVTKNVAKMWEDYAKSIGVSTNDLTKQQKIQAEYNGIMEETRFQTGDAAKLASTYSGQVLQLGYNFNNLKVAVGNALIPIASAVLPGLNAIITALTRVANLFAQVTTALFGRQAAQQQAVANTATNIATSSNDAAKAQNKLADATKKAGKAADGSLASFDELNVLQQDTASGSSSAVDASAPDVSGGSAIDPIGGQEIGAGITVSPAVQAVADTIRGIFAGINDYISTAFRPAFDAALSFLTPPIENFKQTFAQIWSDMRLLADPFLQWFTGDFTTLLQQAIVTGGQIFGGLLDSAQKVFSDLWNIAIYPSLQKMLTVALPMVTQFATETIKTIGVIFDNVKQIFDKIWREGAVPALQQIEKIWFDTWDSIKAFWDKWGVPIFESIREAIQNTGNFLKLIWDTVISPVWNTFMQVVDQLWTDHLKPLLDNFLDFVGVLAQSALDIYNKFILPVVTWFVQNFGPPIVNLIKSIVKTAGDAVGTIIGVVNGIITVLKGIIQFIVGTFTGNWGKAWEGIRDVFKGIIDTFEAIFRAPINAIIDMLNGLIGGINQVIGGLNKIHVDIPDWDIFGDMAGTTFGFNIGKIGAIPRLATGAVIPPRAEFAAILGDQRSGTNIEAPESLIRNIVADEIGKINFQPQVNVIASGDNAGFVRWVKFEVEQENHRIGPAFATGGGR